MRSTVILLFSYVLFLGIKSSYGLSGSPGKVFSYAALGTAAASSKGVELVDRVKLAGINGLPSASVRRRRRDIVDPTAPTDGPSTVIQDNHLYYNKFVAINHNLTEFYTGEFNRIFSTYPAGSYVRLNNAKNLALQIKLNFPFEFYGHPVHYVAVTTGGFVYVNEISHPYLHFSQYIAPLMADFETNSAVSSISYIEAEGAFWVRWENMLLSSNFSLGNFSFQCAFFSNGSIVFDYISVPVSMEHLKLVSPNAKVGLSDAFYYDVSIPGTSHVLRRIVKYHELQVPMDHVVTDGIIHLVHLPTCNQQDSCGDCSNHTRVPGFNCTWCYGLSRCSSGVDRQLQQWQDSDCHFQKSKTCRKEAVTDAATAARQSTTTLAAAAATEPSTADFSASIASSSVPSDKLDCIGSDCSKSVLPLPGGHHSNNHHDETRAKAGRTVLGLVLGLLLLAALATVIGALVYGYRNPGSGIGVWLIEHRPSRLRERIFGGRGGGGGGGGAVFGSGFGSGERYKIGGGGGGGGENAYVSFSNA